MSSPENIQVICRFRPPNKFEQENSELSQIRLKRNQVIECEDPESENKNTMSFTFDYVFSYEDDQLAVFSRIGEPIIKNFFDGWNGAIMAYGQTSSGKTHTMQGNILDEEKRGLVPRIIENLFQRIEAQSDQFDCQVKIQVAEIYMEQVLDLLC